MLCFNSVSRHNKLVDVLKVSHLSFEIFSIFIGIHSKRIIVNLVRFHRKFVQCVINCYDGIFQQCIMKIESHGGSVSNIYYLQNLK